MTVADVADRLLEHPTVRQFLLAFDEKEWPDVVQSTSALGIQALLAKYGQAVRISDATVLRTLARNIARSGCWPASMKLGAPESDGNHVRSGSSRPLRRQSQGRPRRPGRSLPPSAARGGSRLSATLAMQAARQRGRSAPPEMGPLLRSMMMQVGTKGDASSSSRLGPIGHHLQEASRKVSHADTAVTSSAVAGADVQGSEWYARLMSKLQRLNPKPSAAEPVPTLPPGQAFPGGRQQQIRRQLQLPVEGDVQAPQAAMVREGISRQPSLRLDVAGEPLGPASTRDASANRQSLRQQLRLEVDSEASSRPRTPPLPAQVVEPMEPENSVLLSALPSRDDRREWHAVNLLEGSYMGREGPE